MSPGPVRRALLLGLTQGVAEVLPISSSAHLTLVPWLLGWPPQSERTTLAAGLHAGSTIGICWALRRDLVALGPGEALRLAGTTLPAAVTGLLLADLVEARLGRPRQIAALMAAAALALAAADRRPSDRDPAGRQSSGLEAPPGTRIGDLGAAIPAKITKARSPDPLLGDLDPVTEPKITEAGHVTGWAAAAAAVAQVTALAPGVSRNGATLTALRACGVQRGEAHRFSLLMSLPITLGAAGLTLARADRRTLSGLLPSLALGVPTAMLTAASTVTHAPPGPWWPVALYRLGLAATVVARDPGAER